MPRYEGGGSLFDSMFGETSSMREDQSAGTGSTASHPSRVGGVFRFQRGCIKEKG